jgi:hypothetical protein
VVQHHEVDFVAAQHVQRLLAGRGVQDLAGVFEHHANGIAHTGFVVDDEHGATNRARVVSHGPRGVQRRGRDRVSRKSIR